MDRAATSSSRVLDGTAKRIVKPGQVFSRIHVEDIAGVLEASIAEPDPGRAYNVCDDEPCPPQDVVAFAAQLLGMPPPPEIPFEDAELSPMASSFYAESKRVSNTPHQGGTRLSPALSDLSRRTQALLASLPA